ncbi:MAG: alpha-ketoglutarate-dependent dioxygenase AlkB [Myxococcales bacterium]|nr:alpha-ketoglutarate-dependent dioxygenase AlkB [Myxococcales bacterium]
MNTLEPTLRRDADAPPCPLQPTVVPHGRRQADLGAGDSRWEPDFLDPVAAERTLAALLPGGEVPYRQWFHMPDRKRPRRALTPLRRIKCAMTTGPDAHGRVPHYRFPVNDQMRYGVVCPMSPTVEELRQRAQALTGEVLNHAVVLCYRDGADAIGLHKDKLLDLDPQAPIVTISLGAERTWMLRDQIHEPTVEQRLTLTSGGAFVLGPRSNEHFYHSVPRDPEASGVRISVTFRRAATFRDADGVLTGQGAHLDGLNWPESLRGKHRLDADLSKPVEAP